MGAMLTSLVLLSGTVIGGCITKIFNDVYIHVLCEYTLISHANNNVMCHDQKTMKRVTKTRIPLPSVCSFVKKNAITQCVCGRTREFWCQDGNDRIARSGGGQLEQVCTGHKDNKHKPKKRRRTCRWGRNPVTQHIITCNDNV